MPGAVVCDQTRLGRMNGAARKTAEFWRNWRRVFCMRETERKRERRRGGRGKTGGRGARGVRRGEAEGLLRCCVRRKDNRGSGGDGEDGVDRESGQGEEGEAVGGGEGEGAGAGVEGEARESGGEANFHEL